MFGQPYPTAELMSLTRIPRIRSPIERAVVYPALGAIIGAWLGTIPIALDWDRPWQVSFSISSWQCTSISADAKAQAWPLTPAYGAISGYIVASIISLTVNTVRQFTLEQQMRHAERKRV